MVIFPEEQAMSMSALFGMEVMNPEDWTPESPDLFDPGHSSTACYYQHVKQARSSSDGVSNRPTSDLSPWACMYHKKASSGFVTSPPQCC